MDLSGQLYAPADLPPDKAPPVPLQMMRNIEHSLCVVLQTFHKLLDKLQSVLYRTYYTFAICVEASGLSYTKFAL
jgi:hypothetical protein